jgi:phosphoserine phosphatase
MTSRPRQRSLSAHDMEAILGVTSALAAPFDLMTMLGEVVAAAKQVLRADRGSVWLYDAATDELVLEVATGIAPVRVPAGAGLVGACAHRREIINVPDCYADSRFDPSVDKASGYHTRCMLTLPLVDHKDVLVGVMQVLNKADGVFDEEDEALATALAAQCAVALQRVKMTEAVIEGEKMRQALEMAREVQISTLPAVMPRLPSYDVCGTFRSAEQTGGDTFDLSLVDRGLLIVLGDATGHGIAPALSVTQMHAMLRMAFQLGADLPTAFIEVNNRLAKILPDDRFITAFVGLLDPQTHRLQFHSGGQAPIFFYRAAERVCEHYKPTSFPLGAMPLTTLKPAITLDMQPGDILVLLSDGIYECENRDGEPFGEARVQALVQTHHAESTAEWLKILFEAVVRFTGKAPQEDDMTAVVVKREVAP